MSSAAESSCMHLGWPMDQVVRRECGEGAVKVSGSYRYDHTRRK